MVQRIKLSKADLSFIKSYHKEKKNYEGSQVRVADNFDCEARQAPLRVFRKVKRKDYNWEKHENRIKDFYGRYAVKQSDDLIGYVKAVSGFKDNFHGDVIAKVNESISN